MSDHHLVELVAEQIQARLLNNNLSFLFKMRKSSIFELKFLKNDMEIELREINK